MASILTVLHRHGHFIPHLILNDIMVVPGEGDELTIKIDYKLSRYIDPKLDRPAPMLKKLLACHPDILNQRPLDFRSDIWSLGKVFVELLTLTPKPRSAWQDRRIDLPGSGHPGAGDAVRRSRSGRSPWLRSPSR
jgi:serine/threonine protein kinase